MADARTWEERVADWRASGQAAEEYCEGKGFSPGTLYRWSSRVRPPPGGAAERPAAPPRECVDLVRVVRAPVRAAAAPVPAAVAGAVLVEVEGVRVVVPPGADAGTVRVVLEALRGTVRAGR
ncbi:MAG: hypothetical protein L0Y64_25335 [Myxococcaceae bacterium]|nr:hypothetical protein [Myxococcaceae bacterium]